MEPVSVAQSRVVAVSVDTAFAITLPVELPRVFRRWYGPIPPIKEVRDQTGPWATPGQTRTIALKGGGTMHEELTEVTSSSFSYRITNVTGALAPLVDHVDGEWRFTPSGTGTEITWSWVLYPKSALVRPGVALLGKLWMGYARRSLEDLGATIVATQQAS